MAYGASRAPFSFMAPGGAVASTTIAGMMIFSIAIIRTNRAGHPSRAIDLERRNDA